MNREEALKIISPVVESKIHDDIKDDMKIDKISGYTQKYIDAWNFIKDTLDNGSCSECGAGLVIVCEDCGASLCRYCRCYDDRDREVCHSCLYKELSK